MAFCEACGGEINSQEFFCQYCGHMVQQATKATAAVSIPKAANVPPATTAPLGNLPVQKNRSHWLRYSLLGIAVFAVLVIAIAVLSAPSPRSSFEKAVEAYRQGDAQAFENYVDVESVLDDWTDQAARRLTGKANGAGEALAAEGIAAGFKSLIVPRLRGPLEDALLSGRMSGATVDVGANTSSGYISGLLSSGVRAILNSQLSYQGVVGQETNGTEAVLDVQVSSPLMSGPMVVKVKMEKAGDHWRVIAIPEILEELNQLHATS
jgi:Protein of unknown function (DUF2939)